MTTHTLTNEREAEKKPTYGPPPPEVKRAQREAQEDHFRDATEMVEWDRAMIERMSDEQYRTRVLWLSCNVELDDGQAKSIADDWQRARAEEERLKKRVAELESELAIKTGDSDAATK